MFRRSVATFSVAFLLCILLLSISFFSNSLSLWKSTPPSPTKNSAPLNHVTQLKATNPASLAANAALYHKYFDLEPEQKIALKQHGFTDAQIANLDKDDFTRIEGTWSLSAEAIKSAKKSYPSLKSTDLSAWTNAQLDAYTAKQDELRTAPTAQQAQQLQKRGIRLEIARQMLAEYSTYDNLLAQSNATLSSKIKVYTQAENDAQRLLAQKEAIRKEYFENASA